MEISSSSSGLTKNRKSSHVFSWVIENFKSAYTPASDAAAIMEIESPVFEVLHPDGISVTSWTVHLSLDGFQITRADLRLQSCPSKYLQNGGLRCNYGIHAGTTSQPKSHGQNITRYFDLNALDSCGCSSWITFQDLRDKGLLQNSSLRIQAELTIYAQPESFLLTSNVTRASAEAHTVVILEPAVSFESLLKNQKFSDLKLQCGSELFPAHRAILAGRSEVFSTMLMSDMQEAHAGTLHVEDISTTTFDIILRYIYTGKVSTELDPDLLHEIIYGAEKYGLNELKNYCFRKLVQCICEENVGALAVAAHLYGAEENVKVAVKQFIGP